MSIKIYYFTGTGNSLFIAKKVNKKLEDSSLHPMIKELNRNSDINGDVIGLVFPVYMFRAPRIVCKFIKKISSANYIFAVATNGGGMGKVFQQIDSILKKRKLKLNTGISIKQPDNYIPYGNPPEEDKLEELSLHANDKLNNAVKIINKRENHVDNETSFYKKNVWPGLFYHLGYILGNQLDRDFKVSDNCSGCKICVKVCPVDNIAIKSEKPYWNHKCENCFACIQWCPTEQIEYGKKTAGIKRYQHKEINIREIIAQK